MFVAMLFVGRLRALLAVVLILLALLAPVLALAQAAPAPTQRQLACLPGYVLPQDSTAVATPLMQGKAPGVAGEWSAIWCPTKMDAAGNVTFTLSTFAVLDKYRPTPASVLDAVMQVLRAPDSLAEARRLIAGGAVLPAQGTADRYAFDLLHYTACTQAVALPPADVTVTVNNCRKPVQPYIVKATGTTVTTRPVYALVNGVRALTPISRAERAPVGVPCDQTKAQAPADAPDLYAPFAPNFDPSRVALCTPAP